MPQTPKSHKICQITQQSEKYSMTNSCLLVLVDNRKKTDKDDFFVWLPNTNLVTESLSLIDNLQIASMPGH